MLAILLAVSLAAPVPKAKDVDVYFPVKRGANWVGSTDNRGKAEDVTEKVIKVTEKAGVYTVTVEGMSFGTTIESVYEVSAGRVVRHGPKGQRWTMLDLEKAEWTTEWETPDGQKVTIKSTRGKEEEVEVPAGKFKTVPVVERAGESEVQTTHWFAVGVGIVKRETTQGGGSWGRVLKEFTPGK